MEFTKPQEILIKSRFYRWAQVTHGLKDWKLISKLLKEETGIHIPFETLRQNFMPVNKREGKPPRNFTDPERYEALYVFLLSQKFIHPDELTTEDRELSPSYALASYLNGGLQDLDSSSFAVLAGRYEGVRLREDVSEVITLNIDYIQNDKPVTISMTNMLINSADDSEDVVQYSGFAVSDQNGWYLFLLTDTYTKLPVSYALLQTSPSITANLNVLGIGLFEYEGALSGELKASEIEIGPEQKSTTYQLTKDFTRSIITLTRISSRAKPVEETINYG